MITVASLPYELTYAGSTPTLDITLPDGKIISIHMPFERDGIAKLTIEYDTFRGLLILAVGNNGKAFVQRIPPSVLSQLAKEPPPNEEHTP